MFSNIDWLDQVVADVSTAKPFHEAATPAVAVEEKVKVEPCLQGFFINMLQSRGYPATTYASLACGYNNKPTVGFMLAVRYDRFIASNSSPFVPFFT
jgi:hypothetical protein